MGNEADLGVGEIGQMLAGDPDTDVILLFMETIRRPGEIAKFATAAHAAGKPIIAFKLGRSSVGQQLAVAHTGALLSEDSLVDAFFSDLGIMRVTMLEALLEAVTMCRRRSPPIKTRPKVAVVTTTGGGGASACDQISHVGVDLLTPCDATIEKVRATGINVSKGPLTDVTLAGARAEVIGPSLKAMADDPDSDIVLCVLGSSSRASPETALPPVINAEVGDKPLAVYLVPDAPVGLNMLVEAGIPAFRTPESCADVLRAYCTWRTPRMTDVVEADTGADTRVLDEHASLQLLSSAGVMTTMSVQVPLARIAEVALPFEYPVVAKVLSDRIPHKTEAGVVVVSIRNQTELAAAAEAIKTSVAAHHPEVAIDTILVEQMIAGVQEVLVGYQHDAQVGPVVTVAPGGVMVGVYDDKAVRLAPVSHDVAREMIDEVVGFAPLRGHRNQAAGDVAALADAIVAMSRLADQPELCIVEAEANPVIVTQTGAVAVDALVRVTKPE